MFGFIKKLIIGLLTNIVSASNHTKCVSFSNPKCMTIPTLISFHPNNYNQGLRYYPFVVNLDRRVRSCNTLNDLSNKIYVPNKAEDLNLSVFDKITGINESKTLTNMYHANVNLNLVVENVILIKSGITINVDVTVKIWKNIMYVKKIIFGILLHVVAKMVNIS